MCRSILALAVALLLAGCSTPAPQPASPTPSPTASSQTQTFEETITLPPRASREVNVHMDEGAHLRVVLSANVPMTWDLHSHNDTSVDTWEEGTDVRAADVNFTAPAVGTYSVWFRATASTTTVVRVGLTGQFAIED